MPLAHRILLFDLDGVLITPGGYHRALQATVNHFSRRMGLGDLAPNEAEIESLEINGLTSEWDSSAICLAVLVTDLWRRDPQLRLPGTWEGILSAIRARAARLRPQPGYARWGERISAARLPRTPAPRAALALLLAATQSGETEERRQELARALEILLGQTRDFRSSITMRVFQHFTLGSEGFRLTYAEEPSLETTSLLRESDAPTLSAEETQDLVSCTSNGETRAAVFTLRLTKPVMPSAVGGEYAPEAEVTLERVGLAHWPVVGFGQLRWLAGERHAYSDAYLKPSPVHALAAMAKTLGATDEDALLSACRLFEEDRLTGALTSFQDGEMDLHVFEDSPSSLRGVKQAVDLLRGHGAEIVLHPWGIGSSPLRRKALQGSGYPVFGNVGQALMQAGILTHAMA